MAEPDIHISSLVVSCRPERMHEVIDAIACTPGAEVHAAHGGRIAVVLEAADEWELARAMNTFALMPHVYSACIVSHYVDAGADRGLAAGAVPSAVGAGAAKS